MKMIWDISYIIFLMIFDFFQMFFNLSSITHNLYLPFLKEGGASNFLNKTKRCGWRIAEMLGGFFFLGVLGEIRVNFFQKHCFYLETWICINNKNIFHTFWNKSIALCIYQNCLHMQYKFCEYLQRWLLSTLVIISKFPSLCTCTSKK